MIQFLATTRAGCRRLFPRHLLHRIATSGMLAVVCLLTQTLFFTQAKADSATRPNIVLILADDLGYGDVGCYGQQRVETPNIDRLAKEGIRFVQAYAGAPVCTASRAVLMTGLHNGHCPARDNVPHFDAYLEDSDRTFAEMLKSAGYRCHGLGKWSLGDPGTVGAATRQGFDSWFGYLNQDHAHYYFPEYLDDTRAPDKHHGRLELPGNGASREYYSHDLLTARGLDLIDACAGSTEPFLIYIAYTLPHFSAREEDAHGLAVPDVGPFDTREWDARSKKYASMIHLLDRDVGRIVDRIDSLDLNRSTLIVFTSDNGPHANVPSEFNSVGPLRGAKRSLSEGGIRVPFIARWPDTIPSDQTSHTVLAFQDILPTFAELAGIASPENIDGVSQWESLIGKIDPRMEERYLYWDYGHCRKRFDQAVRWRNWKLIRQGLDQAPELFDLSVDIHETTNIASLHPDVVRQLSQMMKMARTEHPRYPIGQIYTGKPIWRPETHNRAGDSSQPLR